MSRMDPQDARQGRKGTPVLRVLIIALVLMAVAGVGMAIYGWSMPDQTLPKGDVGAGTGAPTSTTTPPSQGGSTVTPQSSGTAPGGSTSN